jgi:hypothetical protein
MKARMIKSIMMIGVGAVLCGFAASAPALADGRRDDNYRPGIQVSLNTGVVYRTDSCAPAPQWDRRRDDHRDDRGKFDRRDDRR